VFANIGQGLIAHKVLCNKLLQHWFYFNALNPLYIHFCKKTKLKLALYS